MTTCICIFTSTTQLYSAKKRIPPCFPDCNPKCPNLSFLNYWWHGSQYISRSWLSKDIWLSTIMVLTIPVPLELLRQAPNKSLCSASFLCIPRVDTQPWERGVKYSIVLYPPLLAVGFSTSVLSHTERLQLQFWSEEVWRRRCPAGMGQRDKQSQGDDSKRAQKSSREKLEGHWTASTKAVVWRENTSELCKVFSLSTGRLQRRAATQPVTLERKSVSGKF